MTEHTPQFFLYDSELLDLGVLLLYLSLGTCALIKNTLNIFMLRGSIQFSIPFQFNIYIMHLSK